MIDPKELPVYAALDALGISYQRIEHDAAMTMADCDKIEGLVAGEHCKNLFLCNTQATEFYLLLLKGDKKFKTAVVSKQIGKARLGFANEAQLGEYLGLTPGAVTPMGLINDTKQRVTVLVDRDLMDYSRILVHPNVNTASISLHINDLMRFIYANNNAVCFVDV